MIYALIPIPMTDRSMDDHELAFIRSFILTEKRKRYLELLPNRKRRGKALARLNHPLDIDFSLAVQVHDYDASSVVALLRSEGAGSTCHVIADASEHDGSELSLERAVEIAYVHQFGIILSCIPGKLAFYKPESPGPKFVLRKHPVVR
jgi:hypothetical protein